MEQPPHTHPATTCPPPGGAAENIRLTRAAVTVAAGDPVEPTAGVCARRHDRLVFWHRVRLGCLSGRFPDPQPLPAAVRRGDLELGLRAGPHRDAVEKRPRRGPVAGGRGRAHAGRPADRPVPGGDGGLPLDRAADDPRVCRAEARADRLPDPHHVPLPVRRRDGGALHGHPQRFRKLRRPGPGAGVAQHRHDRFHAGRRAARGKARIRSGPRRADRRGGPAGPAVAFPRPSTGCRSGAGPGPSTRRSRGLPV